MGLGYLDCNKVIFTNIRSKKKRHKTKALISKTMTLYERYTFWYISLPFYAQLQREMTKFKVLCRSSTHDGEFSFFSLNCNAALTNSAPG